MLTFDLRCFTSCDVHGDRLSDAPDALRDQDLKNVRGSEITHLYLTGLHACESCVSQTATNATKLGLKVYYVEDSIGFHDPKSWDSVKAKLEAAGVQIVTTEDVLRKS